MAMLQSTVLVEQDHDHNSIYMRWQRAVDIGDIQLAFRVVSDLLEQAQQPMHVVVDLLNHPNFPLLTTINCVVSGPLTHHHAGEWLVVGGGNQARIFAKTLTDRTALSSIHWFATEAQAEAHFDHLSEAALPSR